jgi:NitT/TauT family transport system ATP-binding protein
MSAGKPIKIRVAAATVRHADPSGGSRLTLDTVDLDIRAGEFLCLLGPSGCGKTTLLNLLAGFLRPSSGTVRIDGVEVTRPDPRHVTLFQEYGLYPWRTVLGNVLFGLQAQRVERAEAERRARAALEIVGLGEAAGRFPHQLSGGMKQRTALARALVVEPDVLFMDEPFGALDTFTRCRLQDELRRIRRDRQPTIVFVTHDIDEAAYLADRVAVMATRPGRIVELLEFPADGAFGRDSAAFQARRLRVFAAARDAFGEEEAAPEQASATAGAAADLELQLDAQ